MCRSGLVFCSRFALATLLALISSGCSDQSGESPTAPQWQGAATRPSGPPGFEAALRAQERHTPRLMATRGVVGTAIALNPAGRAVVKVLTERRDLGGVPATVDEVPVVLEATGRIYARSDPTARRRPAPVGFSVGHPGITAGTIGGRVIDALGNVYVLSNNHVLANTNRAALGDPALQPGPVDGGTDPADRIGTLFAYEPVKLGLNQYGVPPPSNWMDAAIAQSSTALLSNSTDEDGYGVPSSSIYADANGDGFIDDRGLLLGLGVLKSGRTTGLTQGQITGVNVTIDVCYDIFCFKVGRFHDQIAVCCSSFSDGGDSGSLIVSADGNKQPVALLFAGDATQTYGNRIDLVLDRFDVTLDGSAPPPPVTDIAVSAVSAPTAATQGTSVTVGVTVQNVGNQNVSGAIDVTLTDATDQVTIGSRTISGGLAAGASTTLDFGWATGAASLGDHTLTAAQSFADDQAANDTESAVVTIDPPAPGGGIMQVGDLDPGATSQGRTWTAIVTVLVEDPAGTPVSSASVTGSFSAGGKGTGTCVTGSNGTCTIAKSRLRSGSVTFTVTGVTHATRTYDSGGNEDPDGNSDGTSVTVVRP